MDDLVRRAMQKWPNVPACVGWLGLDGRGRWWMRDAVTQQSGSFQLGCTEEGLKRAKGSQVHHPALEGFINRNYQSDSAGCWYFQNGPQKVFVELHLAPLVCRLTVEDPKLVCLHTGQWVTCIQTWLDEQGVLYVQTALGLAQVHTQDMLQAADWIETAAWTPQSCEQTTLPNQFGFVRSPQAEPQLRVMDEAQ